MDAGDTYLLIILLILLLFSSFFSSTETALMSVNKIKLRSLADGGNKRAALALDITENHTAKMLSAILIGNNIVNVSASSLATTLAYSFGGYMVSIATLILTVAILVFGEITPKNYATINAEKLTLRYIPVIKFFMTVMTPVIFIINLFSRGIMLILRVDPDAANKAMTEEELRTIVDVSHEDGVIESEERKLIYNVFDFSDAHAKDIMIPRINMVTVSLDATYDDVLAVFRDSMYTRLPVYEDDKDNIIGLINIKDFILTEDQSAFHVGNILRDAYYTYEYKKIADLMYEMREKTTNVSFVLNEYGATVGMITLEDLLEEIVGEIRDEYDEDEEELIQKMSDDTYLVEGSMKLDDINDALGTDLTSEDYDSIGGLIIDCLDRLPEDGEEVTLENGIHLKVQGIDQNRIVKVLMTIPEVPEEHDAGTAEVSEDHE